MIVSKKGRRGERPDRPIFLRTNNPDPEAGHYPLPALATTLRVNFPADEGINDQAAV
jgi:hypothetical protein